MAPNDLKKMLDERPFVPIEITMSAGSKHRIDGPEFAFVTKFAIYIAEDFDQTGWPESGRYLSIRQVTQVQPLPNAAA